MAEIMRIFRKVLLTAAILLAMALPAACPLSAFQGENTVQVSCEGAELFAYLPGIRTTSAQVQIQVGNEALFSAQTRSLSEAKERYIHTILLFDNSFSISEQNRDVMKQAAEQIVEAHAEQELYTLATFDDRLHVYAQESDDYAYVAEIIRSIEYANQPTFLKDALHAAFVRYGADTQDYTRFIVFSDGCDDKEIGYTYDEIRDLFAQRHFPVYAVGSRFEEDTGALEKMFALSRFTNGSFYLLDEMTDTAAIPADLNAAAPVVFICAAIPAPVQDGARKELKLTVHEQEEEQVFYSQLRMPFADMNTEDFAKTQAQENEAEAQENEAAKDWQANDEVADWTSDDETEDLSLDDEAAEATPATGDGTGPQTSVAIDPQAGAAAGADGTGEEAIPVNAGEPFISEPQKTSFFDDDSLIPGVRNLGVCAGGAAALGTAAALLIRRKRQSEAQEEPDQDDESPQEPPIIRDDDATQLLKSYPDPAVVRWYEDQDEQEDREIRNRE